MKNLLSKQDFKVRLAYRRNVENIDRRGIIIGTTNEESLPNDPTGNRRIGVVEIEGNRAKGCVEDYVDANRIRGFAAARFAFERGDRVHMPEEIKPIQAKTNLKNIKPDATYDDAAVALIKGVHIIAGGDVWTIKGATRWADPTKIGDESREPVVFDETNTAIDLREIDGKNYLRIARPTINRIFPYLVNPEGRESATSLVNQSRLEKALRKVGVFKPKGGDGKMCHDNLEGEQANCWAIPSNMDVKPSVVETEEDEKEEEPDVGLKTSGVPDDFEMGEEEKEYWKNNKANKAPKVGDIIDDGEIPF